LNNREAPENRFVRETNIPAKMKKAMPMGVKERPNRRYLWTSVQAPKVHRSVAVITEMAKPTAMRTRRKRR
jgi:hypothetical protein